MSPVVKVGVPCACSRVLEFGDFCHFLKRFRSVFSPHYWVSLLSRLSYILQNLCTLFPRVVYCISVDRVLVFVCGRVPRTVHVLCM